MCELQIKGNDDDDDDDVVDDDNWHLGDSTLALFVSLSRSHFHKWRLISMMMTGVGVKNGRRYFFQHSRAKNFVKSIPTEIG